MSIVSTGVGDHPGIRCTGSFSPGTVFSLLTCYVLHRCATVSPSVSMTLLPFLASIHPGSSGLAASGSCPHERRLEQQPIGDLRPVPLLQKIEPPARVPYSRHSSAHRPQSRWQSSNSAVLTRPSSSCTVGQVRSGLLLGQSLGP